MKKTFYFLLGVLCLASCQDNTEMMSENSRSDTKTPENEYAISADEALAYLEDFMTEDEDVSTRTAKKRIVSSITPIKYNSVTTRAVTNGQDCENLLYVANFENEEGYAILAGDTRINEKVIAVVDEGNLSEAEVCAATNAGNQERVILDDYPLTGSGFFTTQETGDELFMNPNTVFLDDDAIQTDVTVRDTLVGNFDTDDIGAEDEDGNPLPDTLTMANPPSLPPPLPPIQLCANYALNEVNTNGNGLVLPTIPNLDETIDGGSGGGGGSTTEPRTETEVSNWAVTQRVYPMLSKYVSWGQREPFNDLYPKRRKYIIVGCKRKAPAGCFPLALAKIMTHFKYPDTYTYNGYTVNWEELQNTFTSETGKQSAAHLLRGISSGCNSKYFYQGTFTLPKDVASYMRSLGFTNVHKRSYSFERATELINKGCPFMICSMPNINIFNSHSWNIDGYKVKERTITTNTYQGNVLKETSTTTETYKMVHCDWGWGGSYNGYYVSGIFKLNDSNVDYDYNSSSYNKTTHYNNYIKIITYDKP